MIHGLFLDPRTWKIDYLSSRFWSPEKHGIKIDLHPNAFKIPEVGVDKKYKFAIATEVWEFPMRKTLQYLRNKGLKIIFIPREPVKSKILYDAMFSYDRFLLNGEYYFTPDIILCAGRAYADAWGTRCKTRVVGYTRFEQYINNITEIKSIRQKYAMNKKTVFFPSFPAYYYKKIDGKDTTIDLRKEHEDIMKALEVLSNDFKIIVKVHPMAQKCYNKGVKPNMNIFGTLKKYYDSPSENMCIIKDNRNSGIEAKELLVGSDVTMAFASTMLLEAMLVGKPALNIMFGKMSGEKNLIEYESELPTAKDADQLIDIIKCLECPDYSSSKLIEKYLFKVDGKFCERVCESVNEIVRD